MQNQVGIAELPSTTEPDARKTTQRLMCAQVQAPMFGATKGGERIPDRRAIAAQYSRKDPYMPAKLRVVVFRSNEE